MPLVSRRVVEVNGKLVLGKTREDMHRLLAVSPEPALLVLLRAAPEQDVPASAPPATPAPSALSAQLHAERERALRAERAADGLRADGVRLSHRISYLEDQVAELLAAGTTGTAGTAGPQRSASANVSTVFVTASPSTPSGTMSGSPSPAPGDVQLFQKGSQVSLPPGPALGQASGRGSRADQSHGHGHQRLVCQAVLSLSRT